MKVFIIDSRYIHICTLIIPQSTNWKIIIRHFDFEHSELKVFFFKKIWNQKNLQTTTICNKFKNIQNYSENQLFC